MQSLLSELPRPRALMTWGVLLTVLLRELRLLRALPRGLRLPRMLLRPRRNSGTNAAIGKMVPPMANDTNHGTTNMKLIRQSRTGARVRVLRWGKARPTPPYSCESAIRGLGYGPRIGRGAAAFRLASPLFPKLSRRVHSHTCMRHRRPGHLSDCAVTMRLIELN